MGKKINELTARTDADASNDNWLYPLCDPATGVSGKITVAQAKIVFATQKVKYVATGAEGTTITITALAGKEILSIAREGGTIYEVDSSPDTTEFTWDDTDIVLGLAVTGAGERFLIQYRTR